MIEFSFKKTIFWDVKPEDLDIEKNKDFIIERVLVRGGMNDIKKLFSMYTGEQLISSIKNAKQLDKVTHNFCSNYFNIPKKLMHAPSQYY